MSKIGPKLGEDSNLKTDCCSFNSDMYFRYCSLSLEPKSLFIYSLHTRGSPLHSFKHKTVL